MTAWAMAHPWMTFFLVALLIEAVAPVLVRVVNALSVFAARRQP